MMSAKLFYVCLLCFGGLVNTQEDSCPASYEYNECGSPCATTCDNYADPPFCTAVCRPGCFCPPGTVEHDSMCITTDQCPATIPSCPDSYEYNECGSPCATTCDNYENPPFCLAVCSPGCFCPVGTVEHNSTCITPEQCPDATSSCPASYEYKECGSPCATTCDNYADPSICTAVCRSGCFCPVGTVEHDSMCITTDQCPATTPSCPDSYEYNECGSPCATTCDNYENPPFCLTVCSPGCFCPVGTVEHNSTCITPEQCPDTTPSCPTSYEYNECGSPCATTCNNYADPPVCTAVCRSGCFCPVGTVEHDSTCITVEECPAVGDVCTGGKEWLECGTACPLTCDNYDNPPFACTLQCVQGCFCPAGKVDLNGVCVESSTCAGCQYCQEGQTCTAAHSEDYEYAYCKDPIAVPCAEDLPSSCQSHDRCVTHATTGDSYCLESCYLDNGGCSDDKVCYYERKGNGCNQLLEPCFKTTCGNNPSDTDSCPSGWEIGPCGSLCQRTCEDYIKGEQLACPEICAPPDCVCPRGMVVFRDRCVDPLECYSLLTDEPPLNPLPIPPDSVLLQVTLVGVEREVVDGVQFAEDVGRLVSQLDGYEDVTVSLYAILEDEDGNVKISVWIEGDSIDRETSVDCLADVLMKNSAELNHRVADVNSVNSKAVVADKNGDSDRDDVAANKNGDSDRDDGSDDSLSRGGIAGIVVAITVLSVVIVALIVVVYLVSKNRTSNAISKDEVLDLEKTDLSTKEELT